MLVSLNINISFNPFELDHFHRQFRNDWARRVPISTRDRFPLMPGPSRVIYLARTHFTCNFLYARYAWRNRFLSPSASNVAQLASTSMRNAGFSFLWSTKHAPVSMPACRQRQTEGTKSQSVFGITFTHNYETDEISLDHRSSFSESLN